MSCSTGYPAGAQETVTATADPGYSLTGWSCTGTGVTCPGSDPALTVTIPIGGATVTANFAPISYSFSANALPDADGSVACAGGGATSCSVNSYQYGNVITATATADPGYSFSSWTCSPSSACSTTSASPTSVTIPVGGVTVSANFAIQSYSFSANALPVAGGSVSCAGGGVVSCDAADYQYGNTITVTATNSVGYSFSSWTCSPSSACNTLTTSPMIATVPVSLVTVTANFAIQSYSFSANALPTAGGAVACTGGGATSCSSANYQYGNTITVTATANTGTPSRVGPAAPAARATLWLHLRWQSLSPPGESRSPRTSRYSPTPSQRAPVPAAASSARRRAPGPTLTERRSALPRRPTRATLCRGPAPGAAAPGRRALRYRAP